MRVPRECERRRRGFLEDRRPAANCDPYQVCSKIFRTCVVEDPSIPFAPRMALTPGGPLKAGALLAKGSAAAMGGAGGASGSGNGSGSGSANGPGAPAGAGAEATVASNGGIDEATRYGDPVLPQTAAHEGVQQQLPQHRPQEQPPHQQDAACSGGGGKAAPGSGGGLCVGASGESKSDLLQAADRVRSQEELPIPARASGAPPAQLQRDAAPTKEEPNEETTRPGQPPQERGLHGSPASSNLLPSGKPLPPDASEFQAPGLPRSAADKIVRAVAEDLGGGINGPDVSLPPVAPPVAGTGTGTSIADAVSAAAPPVAPGVTGPSRRIGTVVQHGTE